jgi:hypothetical protein
MFCYNDLRLCEGTAKVISPIPEILMDGPNRFGFERLESVPHVRFRVSRSDTSVAF